VLAHFLGGREEEEGQRQDKALWAPKEEKKRREPLFWGLCLWGKR